MYRNEELIKTWKKKMKQTSRLPVCNIGMFDSSSDFWIDSIEGLLKKYPLLEFAHINTFYMILVLEKANGEITIDNEKLCIDNSQVIIIKPNCINKIFINTEAKGKIICFNEDFFSLRYNNNVLHQFPYLNEEFWISIRLSTVYLKKIELIVSSMLDEHASKKKAFKKVLRSYLNVLLVSFDRLYVPVKTENLYNPVKDKIQRFQKLIESNFKTHKLPSDYAEMLNISTNYLNKICKNSIGQTSGSLIQRQIILEAQRLLKYTNSSVNEIALELGFDHPSYFITSFKKTTNQTPEQYRKSIFEE
ncbi:helix-turn-helix domain-containing protein [Myroides albus]|nr:AraC family transcriptional regulator [Myroides albus]